MKSPFVKTAFMAILAALVSGGAAFFYPWPEAVVESDLVNKPLFESYDAAKVFSMKIEKFNDDKQVVERMLLERSGRKWIIPKMKKFVSTAPTQIALTTKALNELTVLEEVTSDEQEFLSYGVVDPANFNPSTGNGDSVGSKLTLEDRKGRELASLIVGKTRKNDDPQKAPNHFVRIPGQPAIYLVEFDESNLKTDFSSWVDPNLLMLNARLPGFITVDNYQVGKQDGKRQSNYRSKLVFEGGRIKMVDFEAPNEDGELQMMESTPALSGQVEAIGAQIGNIRFPDVTKKPSKLAKAFKKPLSSADESLFEGLKKIGFIKKGFKNGTFDFESLGGEVNVGTADAVSTTLYIGDVAPNAINEGGRLSRYVLICAGVDESLIPLPPKPEDPEDKEYLRFLQQRNEALKSAKIRASEINQRHADWFYLVPENVIDGIRPAVDMSTAKPKVDEEEGGEEKKASGAENEADGENSAVSVPTNVAEPGSATSEATDGESEKVNPKAEPVESPKQENEADKTKSSTDKSN